MLNKKKILHIIPVYAIGGAENLVLHYARNLDKEKYEMYVANTVEDGELRKKLEDAGVHVFVGSRKKDGGRFAVWRKLKKYIYELEPDLIHTHLLGADFFGYWIKVGAHWPVKWVSTQHNVEFNTNILRRILWRFVLREADKVIAVSQAVYNYSNKHFRVPKEKLQLILNGVELSPWLKVSSKVQSKDNKFHLATIGRLEKQKGHRYLMEALSKLKDLPLHWHIYGDGKLKIELQIIARHFNIDKKISWHGVVDDIPNQLVNIDLVVQPSLWEGLSLVVMETMAAGKCVLTTNPAGDELIRDKETGYLIPAKDVDALFEALRYLFENKGERDVVASKAREYSKENFGLGKNIDGVESVYSGLL